MAAHLPEPAWKLNVLIWNKTTKLLLGGLRNLRVVLESLNWLSSVHDVALQDGKRY
jgi:hypothetical protein